MIMADLENRVENQAEEIQEAAPADALAAAIAEAKEAKEAADAAKRQEEAPATAAPKNAEEEARLNETRREMMEKLGIDAIQLALIEQVADLHKIPSGAFNFRVNGAAAGRSSSEHIEIRPKEDKPGIDIIIKAGTKHESVHIPVVLSQTGLKDLVYNDFFIEDDCDVLIVAGCGIHNDGTKTSSHDGIHTFHIGKNSKVKYVEKHYGKGDGKGEKIMNPTTIIEIGENSYMEMETVQIKGIDNTKRVTKAKVADNGHLVIHESLMTHGTQYAETDFSVDLDGADSSAHVVSRAVAKENSRQLFLASVRGNNRCAGRTECDAIIMDHAVVTSKPEIVANDIDASLVHEAAIGRIAGEQLMKLMTLGLTEAQAEEEIVNGFLK